MKSGKILLNIDTKKDFKSLDDVLNDEKFELFVGDRLKKILDIRRYALRASLAGSSLKRNSMNILDEMGKLNSISIINEFKLINEKRSELPSTVRNFISAIVSPAIEETIKFYIAPIRKVFISGPVSGRDYREVKDRFDRVAEMLRDDGYEVVSPVEIIPEGTDWNIAMMACIKSLESCDAIYMLDGYDLSKGASMEYTAAKNMGLKVIFEKDYQKINTESNTVTNESNYQENH